MRRRATLGLVLGCLASSQVGAQDPEPSILRWAALSLIGDKLTVVTHAPKVGSNLDTNLHDTLQLPDATLDRDALKAVADTVARVMPGARVSLLLAGSPSHYERQTDLVSTGIAKIGADLVDAIRGTGATHLILVSKRRAPTNLRTANSNLGSGFLEGLGFYIDSTYKIRRSDTGELGVGFLAPFTYLNVAVVEISTLRVATLVPVTASTTLSVARSKEGADPWDILSPAQKVETIRRMVRREVSAAVTTALKNIDERK